MTAALTEWLVPARLLSFRSPFLLEMPPMSLLKALFVMFFRSFSPAASVKGGSGHFNEQCHPQTYN